MSPVADEARDGRATRRVLALALVAAALLRFAHLDAGLRHAPHMDEQYFVRNVARMLHTGSFDHGFYEYPGLLFYLLAPLLALVGVDEPPRAAAYLAARALLATLGVAAVALVYVFGRRLAGRTAALVAALLVALSTVHVQTAHMLRPDVALEGLTLLALTSFLALGTRWRDDARAGAAAGLALGLKFSAGLLAVPYLVQRVLRPGPRVRGALLAGACAVAVFAAVSPYALLRWRDFGAGVETQLAYHYQAQPEPPGPYVDRLARYAAVWLDALGPVGALLALAGLVCVLTGRPRPLDARAIEAARRARALGSADALLHELLVRQLTLHPPRPAPRLRDWLPFLLLPPLTAAVFASTGYHFDRHMLPSLGIVALLAGVAVQTVHDRWPTLGLALAVLAAVFPAVASARYVDALSQPSTRDRAADWIAAHAPEHARVLVAVSNLSLDAERFELHQANARRPLERLLVRNVDVVASLAQDEPPGVFDGWPAPTLIEPRNRFEGPRIALRLVPPEVQLAYAPLPLDGARFDASSHADALAHLHDGRLDTYWDAEVRGTGSAWLEIAFPQPVRVGRIELLLGDRPHDAARRLRLLAATEGRAFTPVATLRGRPSVRKQLGAQGEASEVLLFEPLTARVLRLERRGGPRLADVPRWSVAELRVDVPTRE